MMRCAMCIDFIKKEKNYKKALTSRSKSIIIYAYLYRMESENMTLLEQ